MSYKTVQTHADNDQAIETVHRVITLLHTLSRFGDKWFGVSQVAEKWGIAKSTTHRYLMALVVEGILEYDEESKKYKVKR